MSGTSADLNSSENIYNSDGKVVTIGGPRVVDMNGNTILFNNGGAVLINTDNAVPALHARNVTGLGVLGFSENNTGGAFFGSVYGLEASVDGAGTSLFAGRFYTANQAAGAITSTGFTRFSLDNALGAPPSNTSHQFQGYGILSTDIVFETLNGALQPIQRQYGNNMSQSFGEVGSFTPPVALSNYRILVASGGKGIDVQQSGFTGNIIYGNVTTPAAASNYFGGVITVTGNHGGSVTGFNGAATGTDGNKYGVQGNAFGTTNAINYGVIGTATDGFVNYGVYGIATAGASLGSAAVYGRGDGANTFAGIFQARFGARALSIDGKILSANTPIGNAGLATGEWYMDTAANILANADLVLAIKQ